MFIMVLMDACRISDEKETYPGAHQDVYEDGYTGSVTADRDGCTIAYRKLLRMHIETSYCHSECRWVSLIGIPYCQWECRWGLPIAYEDAHGDACIDMVQGCQLKRP